MESIFLSAAASAAPTFAVLGYSLPDWFNYFVIFFVFISSLSFVITGLFGTGIFRRLFSHIFEVFKSSEDTNSDEET